jgi:hypothetical protein
MLQPNSKDSRQSEAPFRGRKPRLRASSFEAAATDVAEAVGSSADDTANELLLP